MFEQFSLTRLALRLTTSRTVYSTKQSREKRSTRGETHRTPTYPQKGRHHCAQSSNQGYFDSNSVAAKNESFVEPL